MPYFLSELLRDKNRIEISQEQCDTILEAKQNAVRALSIEERFDILVANYAEYEEAVLQISLRRNLFMGLQDPDLHQDRRTFNRRIINLLSSCRTYLDQSGRDLSYMLNADSSGVFSDLTGREYEEHLSYRLMEALRNYVQHKGFAANSCSVHFERVDVGTEGQVACSVTPQLVKQDLAGDTAINARIRQDLQGLSDRIDLNPHIRKYVESLSSIHTQVRAIVEPHADNWEDTIREAVAVFKRAIGHTDQDAPIYVSIFESDPNDLQTLVNSHALPLGFLDYRRQLLQKNRVYDNLSQRFATGQDANSMGS